MDIKFGRCCRRNAASVSTVHGIKPNTHVYTCPLPAPKHLSQNPKRERERDHLYRQDSAEERQTTMKYKHVQTIIMPFQIAHTSGLPDYTMQNPVEIVHPDLAIPPNFANSFPVVAPRGIFGWLPARLDLVPWRARNLQYNLYITSHASYCIIMHLNPL